MVLLVMAGRYLIDIKDYQLELKSEKINSIARLVKLGIPTVPFPHLLLPESFKFYLKKKKLAHQAEEELKVLFGKLQKAGYTAVVRPSIFAKTPGFEFIVSNRVNLPTFKEVIQAITKGYDKVIKESPQPEKIEFAYLIHGFYTASKAGVVYSEDGLGNVHIEGAFGEHTRVITRAKVQPDIYKVDKKTGQIKEKKISEKDFTLEPSKTGLQKVKLRGEERTKPVFTDQEIKKIYQYALAMEKEYGPQEIECAILRSGEIIFQDSRDSQIKKQKRVLATKNIPIFLREVGGEVVYISQLRKKMDLRQKIVITDNLDIDFITKLVHQFKPRGMILTRGSLTCHAVTILREAKIPSVLSAGLKFTDQGFAEIKQNGEIYCSP